MTVSSERRGLVIVTGASTGIGAATARELAGRGFHVLAGVRRDRDADAIRGPGIEPAILDITDPGHITALAARVDADPLGRPVQALVNNAAVQANVPIEVFAIDEWRRIFEVNLFGQVAMTQSLLPALIRSKGRVVNISSVGGKVAMAAYGPYAATKFALEAVSDSLRREMAPSGVHVIVVEPGAVRTDMLGRAQATAEELMSAMTPEHSRRYGGLVHAVNAQAVSSTEAGLPAKGRSRGDRDGGHGAQTAHPLHRRPRGRDATDGALPARPHARPSPGGSSAAPSPSTVKPAGGSVIGAWRHAALAF